MGTTSLRAGFHNFKSPLRVLAGFAVRCRSNSPVRSTSDRVKKAYTKSQRHTSRRRTRREPRLCYALCTFCAGQARPVYTLYTACCIKAQAREKCAELKHMLLYSMCQAHTLG